MGEDVAPSIIFINEKDAVLVMTEVKKIIAIKI